MKGDGRARILVKLLNELPCGCLFYKTDPVREGASTTWEICWVDDYGDRGTIELVRDEPDLVRALIRAQSKVVELDLK